MKFNNANARLRRDREQFVNEWSVALPGSPYVASKHAVMGLTRSAALDYAKQGIRINAVNPRLRLTSWLVALTRWASRLMI